MRDILKAIIFAIIDIFIVILGLVLIKNLTISILVVTIAQIAFVTFLIILVIQHKEPAKPVKLELKKPTFPDKMLIKLKKLPQNLPQLPIQKPIQQKPKPTEVPVQTTEKIMNIEELKIYITTNLKKGFTKDQIKQKVESVGWPSEEVNKLFQEIAPTKK